MQKFLKSNDTVWRLARTAVQGLLGIVVANLDLLVGKVLVDAEIKTVVVASVMCILSPIMAELGKGEE